MRLSLPLRFLALAALLGGCDDCGSDEPEGPVVPNSINGEASGFSSFGTVDEDEGSGDAPERPVIVHEAPPTLADFAVTPVTEWTTFRGNASRSGVREVRAITTPEIAWSIQVGIQGYANTVVATDDAVYVASQGDLHQREDGRDGVYAIDPETGAIRWRFATDQDANGLTLAGDVLIVGTDNRQLIGVNTSDGKQRWEITQDCQIYHAPVVRDGTAYLIRTDEAGYLAIDTASGNTHGSVECVRSERGAISADEDRIYRAGAREMSAYDALGKAWRDDTVTDVLHSRTRWAPPLLTENMLIDVVHNYPFEEGGRVDLRPAAVARWQDNGQVAWVIDVNDAEHANPEPPGRDSDFLRSLPWIHDGRLYWTPTNNGLLVAYDVVTGERLEQVAFPDCRNRAFGSIVGTPEMAYYARHDGVLYGFTPAPLNIAWQVGLGLHGAVGRETTHFPVQGPCSAEPKDGSALFATPTIGPDGTLYVGSGDGWLYAIRDANW